MLKYLPLGMVTFGLTLMTTIPSAQAQMFINGKRITPRQQYNYCLKTGYVAPAGNYWYDARTGWSGNVGHGRRWNLYTGKDAQGRPIPRTKDCATSVQRTTGQRPSLSERR